MVPEQRGRILHKDSPKYQFSPDDHQPSINANREDLGDLLQNAPLP